MPSSEAIQREGSRNRKYSEHVVSVEEEEKRGWNTNRKPVVLVRVEVKSVNIPRIDELPSFNDCRSVGNHTSYSSFYLRFVCQRT